MRIGEEACAALPVQRGRLYASADAKPAGFAADSRKNDAALRGSNRVEVAYFEAADQCNDVTN
jgi:hypothetical protein